MIPLRSSATRLRATSIGYATLFIATIVTLSSMTSWSATAASPGEISTTDGTRTLTVSNSVDLDPASQTLRVTGSGYDITKGIYVGLCVVQPANEQPSPCGGGIDKTGSSGSSVWISSNPPSYGVGLAIPYGDYGSFDVEITVSAAVNAAVDCRRVECAIVTKSDHTIVDDRSQDLVIPVTFTGDPPPLPETTVASPSDDSVSEITVAPGVEDLTGVATANDSAVNLVLIVVGVAVVVVASSLVIVSTRRSRARRGR